MRRRTVLALLGTATAGSLAGCSDLFGSTEPVFPIEKSVSVLDESTTPTERISVLFRYETKQGEFEYSEQSNSPIYDGTAADKAFVSPPEPEDPLLVDDTVHEWLSGRYDEVIYNVHACDHPSESDDPGCRSHHLTHSDFNEFTLEDAIVLGETSAGEPARLRRVEEGDGMYTEVRYTGRRND